jgi:hypothetical protein
MPLAMMIILEDQFPEALWTDRPSRYPMIK